jgi:hypothetical protein
MLERRDLLRRVISRARLDVEEFDAAWAALDRLADTALRAVNAPTIDLEAEGHTFVPVALACSHCGKTPFALLMERPVVSPVTALREDAK